MDAKFIKQVLCEYYRQKAANEYGWKWTAEYRINIGFEGKTGYIDFIAINPYLSKRAIICYEIKVSRQDFFHDLSVFHEKQRTALDICTKFYYICPKGLISISEVPQEAGLVFVSDNGKFKVMKSAQPRLPNEGIQHALNLLHHFAENNNILKFCIKFQGKEITTEQLQEMIQSAILEEKMKLESKYSDLSYSKQAEIRNKVNEELNGQQKLIDEIIEEIAAITGRRGFKNQKIRIEEMKKEIAEVSQIKRLFTTKGDELRNIGQQLINFADKLKGDK